MKRFFAFLKEPPLWFLAAVWLVTLLCIGGSVAVLALGYRGWGSYAVYACSAVFLGYSVYTLVRCLPRVRSGIRERAKRHPFANNMMGNYGFRTVVFAVASFVINVGFALFNGILGILLSSVWYGVFACYYLCLSALRGGILFASGRAKKRAEGDGARLSDYKLRIYRLCGIALFVLEVALSAAVTLMILSERPTRYSQIMAIATAAYTFYKVIFAVVNLVKVTRLQDPVLQCFRNINLTDAAVSLLSLQVTMVAVFSDGTDGSMWILNAVTGFVVCALTVVIGVLMIARASVKLKRNREERADERQE